MGNIVKKCAKCEGTVFTIIEVPCCANCRENGAFYYALNGGKGAYTYDEKIIMEKGLFRDQAFCDNECRMGTSFDEGCWIYTCSECRTQFNMPFAGTCH